MLNNEIVIAGSSGPFQPRWGIKKNEIVKASNPEIPKQIDSAAKEQKVSEIPHHDAKQNGSTAIRHSMGLE